MPNNVQTNRSTKARTFCISAACLCLTVPYTTIEFHTKANTHNPVGQGVKAHHAGHDGRAQVFQHNIIGVLIPWHHLEKRSTNVQSQCTSLVSSVIYGVEWISPEGLDLSFSAVLQILLAQMNWLNFFLHIQQQKEILILESEPQAVFVRAEDLHRLAISEYLLRGNILK